MNHMVIYITTTIVKVNSLFQNDHDQARRHIGICQMINYQIHDACKMNQTTHECSVAIILKIPV